MRVARKKERLIDAARQQREGIDLTRHAHDIVVRGVLPGAREYPVLLRAKKCQIGIHTSRQRARDTDIRIDRELEFRFVHLCRCYRTQP